MNLEVQLTFGPRVMANKYVRPRQHRAQFYATLSEQFINRLLGLSAMVRPRYFFYHALQPLAAAEGFVFVSVNHNIGGLSWISRC